MFLDKDFIGKKFKEYRKKSKLTQEELSEKIGIAEKHYGKLERGVFTPSLETFFKVVEVLKIPFSEFGITVSKENNIRDNLLKEIYLFNDKEIQFVSDFIKSFKKYNEK